MQQLRYSRYIKSIIISIDIVVVAFCFLLALYFSDKNVKQVYVSEDSFLILVFLLFFWVILSGRTKLYSIPRSFTYVSYLERLITHIITFVIGVIMLAKISHNEILNTDLFKLGITLFISLFFTKSAIFFALKILRSTGANHRNIMFLELNSNMEILKETFQKRKDYGFKLFEYTNSGFDLENLTEFWKKNGIHTVFLPSNHHLSKQEETDLFKSALQHKIAISIVPKMNQPEFYSYELSYAELVPILTTAKFPLDYDTNGIIKRIFDILFSVIILVGICSWLFPVIAFLIKLDSKGPIFFKQKRYGFHEHIFTCLKFRTMVENEHSTKKTTSENDYRITKIGKLLRISSLDELPQFINVLLGNMSVVGPRPHMILVDDYYKPKIGKYAIRSLVKPGITGLAQVNGLRGDKGDMNLQMRKRIIADSYYVKNWSFSLDIVIILKTISLLITGDKNAQ